jgi:hypothetical protein
MGKSFNDDVFNNDFNLDSINGLNISQEAIKENQEQQEDYKAKLKSMVGNINLDKVKEEIKEQKKKQKEDIDPQEELRRTQEKLKRLQEEQQEHEPVKDNIIYTKKTMIFRQDYLDIIDGLAELNDMQIKDVLNQLLDKSINMLDDKTREKALKTGRKNKPVKQDKSIF